MKTEEPTSEEMIGDSRWFREPNRRELWIAAGLFVFFGIFFVLLFVVQRGWWFRWVILGLGIISILRGLRDAVRAIQVGE